ncbi:hypothetical protein ATO6_11330 [Oceanicola sp. 22II-s10i]|uniref:hypothetical protein n=1 Tax=Oceanicola sp. 22II-s10i TaxID=1317116 RepID=UPI000B5264FE|nr:hypothetical protein [Oceanicola sp. 22II-s10i]OWU84897.1 hypothetical protein ATO6_11330 [Oceanicola sp. 22II-s10i]
MQRKTQTALAALMALGIAGGATAGSLGASADVNAGNAGSVGASMSASSDNAMGANANANANAGSMGSEMSNSTTADASTEMSGEGFKTYGDLVSSFRTADTSAADLSGFDAESDVSFTTLSSLQGEGAENGQALDNMLSERTAELDEMRGQIEANSDLMAALEAEGYEAEDVIAVQANSDTSVNIVVDDRS